jgi:hypothetical protein
MGGVTMSEHTTPIAEGYAAVQDGSADYGFETPDGLRALLIRPHESGPGSWRDDRDAAELMRYAALKYRQLARKYGLDAWEVASAAFETMLHRSTRAARNPWAVVTRAVQITCRAEVRAAGLMMATDRVRHTDRIAGFHDAIRFADREHLTDYHPAFAVTDATDDDGPSSRDQQVSTALSEIVSLFVLEGWDLALVTDCVEHVAYRLADLSSRATAMEAVRRDRVVPMLLGVPQRSWVALLRIMLGSAASKYSGTPLGDGVLLRLLSGEPVRLSP